MSEDVHARMLQRPNDAARHVRLGHVEFRVDRDQHDIERGQCVVIQVQRPIVEDVDLGSREYKRFGRALPNRVDRVRLLVKAAFVRPPATRTALV